jgi:hypothetical protein|tara:strand:- start:276 stop:590 length:315 start_codon:yes stop_codon:yes gene_type:complete
MSTTNKIIVAFMLLAFLSSCGSISDAKKVFRNQKIKTTDEFLVKKRDPLSLPPDFRTIPEPGSLKTKESKTEKKINEILKISEEKSSSRSKSSVEKSIISEIGK